LATKPGNADLTVGITDNGHLDGFVTLRNGRPDAVGVDSGFSLGDRGPWKIRNLVSDVLVPRGSVDGDRSLVDSIAIGIPKDNREFSCILSNVEYLDSADDRTRLR